MVIGSVLGSDPHSTQTSHPGLVPWTHHEEKTGTQTLDLPKLGGLALITELS